MTIDSLIRPCAPFITRKARTCIIYEKNNGVVFSRDYRHALKSKNFVFMYKNFVFVHKDKEIDEELLRRGTTVCRIIDNIFVCTNSFVCSSLYSDNPGIPLVSKNDSFQYQVYKPDLNIASLLVDLPNFSITSDDYKHGPYSRKTHDNGTVVELFNGYTKTTFVNGNYVEERSGNRSLFKEGKLFASFTDYDRKLVFANGDKFNIVRSGKNVTIKDVNGRAMNDVSFTRSDNVMPPVVKFTDNTGKVFSVDPTEP